MSDEFNVDRRVTLKWLAGAMAMTGVPVSGGYAAQTASPWTNIAPPPVTAPGYGTDPTMLEPVIPWPKTLAPAELETAAALSDTILPAEGKWPAPSKVGVHHFIDEWVSAPYLDQQADRRVILSGFAWVEAQASARHGRPYAKLDEAGRALILADAAKADPQGQAFIDKMKFLVTGAYYTSEPGVEELGYVGNTPIEGDYPGPTPEALAHLDGVLAKLNLKRK